MNRTSCLAFPLKTSPLHPGCLRNRLSVLIGPWPSSNPRRPTPHHCPQTPVRWPFSLVTIASRHQGLPVAGSSDVTEASDHTINCLCPPAAITMIPISFHTPRGSSLATAASPPPACKPPRVPKQSRLSMTMAFSYFRIWTLRQSQNPITQRATSAAGTCISMPVFSKFRTSADATRWPRCRAEPARSGQVPAPGWRLRGNTAAKESRCSPSSIRRSSSSCLEWWHRQ